MAVRQLPDVRFPFDLDDLETLLRVFNRTESVLSQDMKVMDDAIWVRPDFDRPEVWSASGGFVTIDDEDIYYGRGVSVYASPGALSHIPACGAASGTAINLPGGVGADTMTPDDAPGNMAAAGLVSMSLAATLDVGGVRVDVAVSGDGAHGHGAVFKTTRPDVLLHTACSVDCDNGLLVLTTGSFSYKVTSLVYRAVPLGSDGLPAKRITRLEQLIRGLNDTVACAHAKGSYARGPIVAAHHRLLARAVQALEKHAGIDYSGDESSLDFRLRDLADLCVEADDWDCPEVYLDYNPVATSDDAVCGDGNVFQFNVEINGDYNYYLLKFGDGTETDELSVARKNYSTDSRIEPAVVVANDQCAVTNAFFDHTSQDAEVIPEIADLVCPDCEVAEPITLPDTYVPDMIDLDLNLSIPDIFISIPTWISMPDLNIPTQINITIPPFTFVWPDPPKIDPLTINYTINISPSSFGGPCFELVPCDGGHCHGL